MDQYPLKFENRCDYGCLKVINTLLKEDRFLHVRNMIRVKTPFGELIKMDHQPRVQKFVALNAVKAWNGKKLVIGNKEYEIDSVLPRYENRVPIFIQQAIPQMCKNRKKFNSHVVAVFWAKDDAKYFYLLDDSHFDNLKLYKFDEEVAKFLRDGILTAKNAKTRTATVSGCLHIIECLYSQEKLPMIHSQNKRERQKENEELDESSTELDTPLSCKRPEHNTGNCSEEYRLKKEPQSEIPKTEVIDIKDDSSEEHVDEEDEEEVTDDEVQFEEVPKPFMTVKRETIDKATSSFEYMGPGQPFEGRYSSDCVVLNDGKCENVGGFSVLKTQARFYEKIWKKYGHITSNKVLKDSYAQQPVVSGIMTTIIHMHYCRFSDLTSEIIEVWEDNIKNAEKIEFNIWWVREWLEDAKKVFFGKEKLVAAFIEQDELLQIEKKKSVEAKYALEEAEDNIAALRTKMSLLIKERQSMKRKIAIYCP
ncbi:hypothetical protein MKX01_034640 [Papaver californicum]|nr:hypothetical protein MKX01_034640 [Papaver californicum]